MPYEVEETGNLTRTAQVTVEPEEYKSRVNDALRELSKDVNIRGFRKGKVPLSVMKKRYGAQVQQDVVEDLVRDKLNEIVSESEEAIIHVGQPDLASTPEDDEGLQFSVEFEIRPDIDPIGYLGLELERSTSEVTSEEIDQRLEAMRHEYAALEPIAFRDTIEEGDVVTFDYKAIGDREELEGIEGENAQIEVGEGQAISGLDEGLIGVDFDSTVTVDVTPEEHFPVEELVGETFELEVDIKSVKKQVLPELDDDFAKDTGDAETLLELRGQIREELEEEREHEAMHAAEDELVEKLLEQNPFELPPRFVEEQVNRERNQRLQMLEQFTQQGMSPEQLGIDMDDFTGDEVQGDVEDRIRADFLFLAIAEKEGLELEEDDLRSYIEHRARHSRVSPQQLMMQMMQDQEQLRQTPNGAVILVTEGITESRMPEFEEVEETEEAEDEEEAEEAAEEEAEEEAAEEEAAEQAEEEAEEEEEDKQD